MSDLHDAILQLNEKLWALEKRLDALESFCLKDDNKEENLSDKYFDPVEWIESVGKSSLVRSFAIYATLLGSAWKFTLSVTGEVPFILQIIVLGLIFLGSVWVLVRLIQTIMKRIKKGSK